MTKGDVYNQFNAWVSPEGKAFADRLLASAKKTAPHPMAPKDKELRLHKMLKHMLEGKDKRNGHESGAELRGKLDNNKEAGEALVAKLEKDDKKFGDSIKLAGEDGSDDDSEAAKKKKEKKEKAEEKRQRKRQRRRPPRRMARRSTAPSRRKKNRRNR